MSGAYRDRLFRPGDVRRILRRAAELQDGERTEEQAGRPQTRDEIARTAADAGISEAILERALAEDGAGTAATSLPKVWSWTGAPARIAIERTVERAISPQSHGKLVKVMRRAVGELGNPQAFGESLSWSATLRPSGGGRDLHAVVEPGERGTTVVRIEENLRGLRGGLMGGLVGGVGGGGLGLIMPLIAAFAPHFTPFAIPLWILFVYLVARRIYQARFRAREAQLRALAETLVAELSAAPDGGRIGAPPPNVRIPEGAEPVEELADEDAAPGARGATLSRR
jgi:hypothetical protein